MNILLFALWFFLPAGIANSSPLLACRIPGLKNMHLPLDLGHTFRGKRLFGSNKTWRGLIFGMFVAAIVFGLQAQVYTQSAWVRSFSLDNFYTLQPALLMGILFGGGALAGDALESLIKRQVGINPGERWFPFDQLDYILGGLAATALVAQLTWQQLLAVIIVWFVMHIIASYIGYRLGIRRDPI